MNKVWRRGEIRACSCSGKPYDHVHCPCQECNGAACPRSLEIRHWKAAQNFAKLQKQLKSNESRNQEGDTPQNSDTDAEFGDSEVDAHRGDEELMPMDIENDFTLDNSEGGSEHEDDACGEMDLRDIVVRAVLKALQLHENTKTSTKNFEEILAFGKGLFCDGLGEEYDQDIIDAVWPKNWREAQNILKEHGYSDPQEYFICYCRKKAGGRNRRTQKHVYSGKWDILTSKKERCRHCGRKGKVPYYYLGLNKKVQKWCQDEKTCRKHLGHWDEKEHWLEREEPFDIRKEIWDGDRFRELAWFWDENATWLLPALCPNSNCKGVVSTGVIETLKDEQQEGQELTLECPVCYTDFSYNPAYAHGDPRNLAYIGHWDGWSPYKHGNHSSGAIEVTVANMSKSERTKIEEVYVIGFVPFNQVPKDNPHLLDPFLQPLVDELKEGFVNGIEVNYAHSAEDIPKEKKIRHLLLCFTADYPGICEVGKFLNGGRSPCRRCKVKGETLPTANFNQMYYGDNRLHGRYPWEEIHINHEEDIMQEIQREHRKTVRKKLSSQHGFTGVSVLHQLYLLYGFDILKDMVYDIHHLLPLNAIKNQVDRFVEEDLLNPKDVEQGLSTFPWTSDLKDGRVPTGFDKRRGHWKAEEYQKFCFPVSECIIEALLPSEEYEIWTTLARLTELHYVCGRNGWTSEMISQNHNLALKFNILVEEIQGLRMCRITNHNLLHTSADLIRFSASDNFWCYNFERAVKKYVRRSSNCKHIEKTYAHAEERREVLKTLQKEEENNARIQALVFKGVAKSHREAKMYGRSCVLGSSRMIHGFCEEDALTIADMLGKDQWKVSRASCTSKKAFLFSDDSILRKGESFIAILNGSEHTFCAEAFHSVSDVDKCIYTIVKAVPFSFLKTDGTIDRHYWTGFPLVSAYAGHYIFLMLSDVRRKVVLLPCAQNADVNIVVDYKRQILTSSALPVVVPCYPEVGDMLRIQGEDSGDTWYGHVRSVDAVNKSVAAHFYIRNSRWPNRNLYVRETYNRYTARETVHWNSILSLAHGEWVSGNSWRLL